MFISVYGIIYITTVFFLLPYIVPRKASYENTPNIAHFDTQLWVDRWKMQFFENFKITAANVCTSFHMVQLPVS